MFSDYNRIKLKMTNKKISGKNTQIKWKLNNISLNNPRKKKKQEKLENILN